MVEAVTQPQSAAFSTLSFSAQRHQRFTRADLSSGKGGWDVRLRTWVPLHRDWRENGASQAARVNTLFRAAVVTRSWSGSPAESSPGCRAPKVARAATTMALLV